jgi:hypothetical protein
MFREDGDACFEEGGEDGGVVGGAKSVMELVSSRDLCQSTVADEPALQYLIEGDYDSEEARSGGGQMPFECRAQGRGAYSHGAYGEVIVSLID